MISKSMRLGATLGLMLIVVLGPHAGNALAMGRTGSTPNRYVPIASCKAHLPSHVTAYLPCEGSGARGSLSAILTPTAESHVAIGACKAHLSSGATGYLPCGVAHAQLRPLSSTTYVYGPVLYGEFVGGNLVGEDNDYLEAETNGYSHTWIDEAYIQYIDGPSIKQEIYARVWDNTTGAEVTEGTYDAPNYNKGTEHTPIDWLLIGLVKSNSYHWTFHFAVWLNYEGVNYHLVGPDYDSATIVCSNTARCDFS